MRKRLLLLMLSVVALGVSGCSQTADPPNIVLIISDDQAWGDYGFMGHDHIRTSHIDRLAREALTFTRGYVPSSLCRPSLTTIVTGSIRTNTASSATTRRPRQTSRTRASKCSGKTRATCNGGSTTSNTSTVCRRWRACSARPGL